MNKAQLIKSITELLRQNNIKKPISIPKQVFHISDNDGNTKDFTIKRIDKTAIYTLDDVGAVIEACIEVMKDALKRGEPITVLGFGTLKLVYRKPRMTKSMDTGEEIVIEGRYVPKFSFGQTLRMCAKVYDMSLTDRVALPDPVYDDDIAEEGEAEHTEDGE